MIDEESRVAILSMHPAPYRDPLLARVKALHGDAVEILTLHQETVHKEWRLGSVPYDTKIAVAPVFANSRFRYHPGVVADLRARQFDVVVVPGYLPLTLSLAAVSTLESGSALVYSADTIPTVGVPRPRAVSRHFARRASAIWVPGKAARGMWESEGVPANRIFEGMYTLSEAELDRGVEDRGAIERLAAELGVAGRFVYLFVGKLLPHRRVMSLVRAFLALSDPNSALVVVGDGPESGAVIAAAAAHSGACIRHVPSVRYAELHKYYALAGAYVHPGAEPYSLALQEAAFLGVPIVATRDVGAAHDFLPAAGAGAPIEPRDDCALREALHRVRYASHNPLDAIRARRRGLSFAVEQFEQMLVAVTQTR